MKIFTPWKYVGAKLVIFFALWMVVDSLYIHKDLEWYSTLFFIICLLGSLFEEGYHVSAYTDKIRQLERRVAELEKQAGIEKKERPVA